MDSVLRSILDTTTLETALRISPILVYKNVVTQPEINMLTYFILLSPSSSSAAPKSQHGFQQSVDH